jgi:hypothetical protein
MGNGENIECFHKFFRVFVSALIPKRDLALESVRDRGREIWRGQRAIGAWGKRFFEVFMTCYTFSAPSGFLAHVIVRALVQPVSSQKLVGICLTGFRRNQSTGLVASG